MLRRDPDSAQCELRWGETKQCNIRQCRQSLVGLAYYRGALKSSLVQQALEFSLVLRAVSIRQPGREGLHAPVLKGPGSNRTVFIL
jgi:hypothetical protein